MKSPTVAVSAQRDSLLPPPLPAWTSAGSLAPGGLAPALQPSPKTAGPLVPEPGR